MGDVCTYKSVVVHSCADGMGLPRDSAPVSEWQLLPARTGEGALQAIVWFARRSWMRTSGSEFSTGSNCCCQVFVVAPTEKSMLSYTYVLTFLVRQSPGIIGSERLVREGVK